MAKSRKPFVRLEDQQNTDKPSRLKNQQKPTVSADKPSRLKNLLKTLGIASGEDRAALKQLTEGTDNIFNDGKDKVKELAQMAKDRRKEERAALKDLADQGEGKKEEEKKEKGKEEGKEKKGGLFGLGGKKDKEEEKEGEKAPDLSSLSQNGLEAYKSIIERDSDGLLKEYDQFIGMIVGILRNHDLLRQATRSKDSVLTLRGFDENDLIKLLQAITVDFRGEDVPEDEISKWLEKPISGNKVIFHKIFRCDENTKRGVIKQSTKRFGEVMAKGLEIIQSFQKEKRSIYQALRYWSANVGNRDVKGEDVMENFGIPLGNAGEYKIGERFIAKLQEPAKAQPQPAPEPNQPESVPQETAQNAPEGVDIEALRNDSELKEDIRLLATIFKFFVIADTKPELFEKRLGEKDPQIVADKIDELCSPYLLGLDLIMSIELDEFKDESEYSARILQICKKSFEPVNTADFKTAIQTTAPALRNAFPNVLK